MVFCIGILLLFNSCGIYSFSGAVISPDVKTVTVANFVNETGLGPTSLAQNFTERLKNYFQSNTNLRIVRTGGDVFFEGAIVGYSVSPVSPSATESSLKNRLTMRVKVRYENKVDTSQKFNQEFSFYDDYDQRESLAQVEDQKIENITSQLALDIFNKAFQNW